MKKPETHHHVVPSSHLGVLFPVLVSVGMAGRVGAEERREWNITEEVARSNNSGNLSDPIFFPVSSCKRGRWFLFFWCVSRVGIYIHIVSARWGPEKISYLVAILTWFHFRFLRNYAPSWTILGSGDPMNYRIHPRHGQMSGGSECIANPPVSSHTVNFDCWSIKYCNFRSH